MRKQKENAPIPARLGGRAGRSGQGQNLQKNNTISSTGKQPQKRRLTQAEEVALDLLVSEYAKGISPEELKILGVDPDQFRYQLKRRNVDIAFVNGRFFLGEYSGGIACKLLGPGYANRGGQQMIPAPEAFKSYRQFILWSGDKIPVNPQTLRPADPHDPATRLDYQTAAGMADLLGPGYGLGFVFTDNDPFFFLDIDHCGPDWSPLARQLCQAFAGCAVEVSVSGTGLHVFGSGPVPPHSCKNGKAGLELYTSGRFAALTGTGLTGDAAHFPPAETVKWLVDTYFTPSAPLEPADWTDGPCEGYGGPADDLQLIDRMLASKSVSSMFGGRASVLALWTADVDALAAAYPALSDTNPYDHSSADAALCAHLAFWTGKDCERMDRLFRMSGLVRDKWTDREKYRRDTILKAVAGCRNVLGAREVKTEAAVNDPTGIDAMLISGETVSMKPVQWFWPDRIPRGKLTTFTGEGGVSKTLFFLTLAAIASHGGYFPMGEGYAPCGSSIYISGEDDISDTLLPRYILAGGVREKIKFVDLTKINIDLTSGLGKIADLIDHVGDVVLLIIDPITAFLGESQAHISAEIQALMSRLGRLAESKNVSVLGLVHFNKDSKSSAVHRVSGSAAFVTAARAACACVAKGDEKFFNNIKNNLGKPTRTIAYRVEGQPFDHSGFEGQTVPRIIFGDQYINQSIDDLLQDRKQGDGIADKFMRSSELDRAAAIYEEQLAEESPLEVKQVRDIVRELVGATRLSDAECRQVEMRIGATVKRGKGRGMFLHKNECQCELCRIS
ncbi:MAG: AAA family ATPase [Thermodesulfobacteriota bacterium]